MNELIKIENGISVLDGGTSDMIANFERQIKALKEKEDALKEAIKSEMEAKGIIKITDDFNGLSITLVEATERETFDSKQLRADDPDLCDQYVKMTPVKSSIRIKVKE